MFKFFMTFFVQVSQNMKFPYFLNLFLPHKTSTK